MADNRRRKALRLLRLQQAGGTDKELTILTEIMNLEDDFQAKIDQITQEFKDSVKDIKDNVPSLESLISSIKGFTGPPGEAGNDGKSPTDEELLALIKPLIPPPPKDGATPTSSELLALIRPLIPEVQDGETPTDDHLLSLIKPLIPEATLGKDGSPDTPEEIVSKLTALEEPWLEQSAIKGFSEFSASIFDASGQPRWGGGTSQIGVAAALGKMFKHEKFATTAATTTVTLVNTIAGGVCIWLRYNGQMLHYGDQYTVSNKTITFTFTLDTPSEVEVTYIRG